ncbi:hypothetical protein HDU79_004647 [Rhizoclosmatium sp. JEL0117]|nr:hypothetical protein HDU79_004647 [Rhizoclosmatium sp. JEL0117]
MVSFVCESCQETIKKPKLDQHKQRCYYAQFTCIDCSTTFQGNDYKTHTSCISEAEKYQKSVYKAPKKGQQQQQQKQAPAPAAASTSSSANISAAPKSAPLIAQLSETKDKKRAEPEQNNDEEEEEKTVSKKSKKESKEDSDFDFKKTIKSVLKKDNGLTLEALRAKVASKISKKRDGKVTKEDIASKFDESVTFTLGEDGTITIQ